jgi:hypothetical protein
LLTSVSKSMQWFIWFTATVAAFLPTSSLCPGSRLTALPPPTVGNIQSGVAVAQERTSRPVHVQDVIEMTRLADSDYFLGDSATGRVAHFSPNGKKFVVILKKGNVQRNRNEFSLFLEWTEKAIRFPAPKKLITMYSVSNRDAIAEVKWLDNDVVAFLGESGQKPAQVYTLNTRTLLLERRTAHPTPIVAYDITATGDEIVYIAEPLSSGRRERDPQCQQEVVITNQRLSDLLSRGCRSTLWNSEQRLYFQRKKENSIVVSVPRRDAVTSSSPILLSPDGSQALIGAFVKEMPSIWAGYKDERLHELVTEELRLGPSPFITRYELLTTKNLKIDPLLDTPMLGGFASVLWAANSQAVFIRGAYLPLNAVDSVENEKRKSSVFDLEIALPGKGFRKISQREWPLRDEFKPDLEVTLEEGLNSWPRILGTSRTTGQQAVLWELNPQLHSLDLGKAQKVDWTTSDGKVSGVLYLPPDFASGTKYPLVIQMHGFNPQRFSMDGRADWGSGFAARPLAAEGIVVLQMAGGGPVNTPKEGSYEMVKIEQAIDHFSEQGLIDPARVGLIGFSRGSYDVAYTITHSRYPIRAAILVDGFYGGYFQSFSFPSRTDFADVNGGAPYGEGLRSWFENCPSFSLDKVRTPVRLVALSEGPLVFWEWFTASREMGKPVDYVWVPDSPHLVVKPWQWMASAEGTVDWFRFWLIGEEDHAPSKAAQFSRWRALLK